VQHRSWRHGKAIACRVNLSHSRSGASDGTGPFQNHACVPAERRRVRWQPIHLRTRGCARSNDEITLSVLALA
jgi:hypothetical protein